MDETCGGCRFFKVTRKRDDGRLGECRLAKVLGVFREAMRACPSFSRLGAIEPAEPVRSMSRRTLSSSGGGASRVPGATLAAVLGNLSGEQLRSVLLQVLGAATLSRGAELGRTWSAGELVLAPREDELKVKQLPLDALFHKLVMVRDNLRVMEQKINSHEHLQDAEKLDLQLQVTLAYTAGVRFACGFLDRQVAAQAGASGEAIDLLLALMAEGERTASSLGCPPLGERWQGGEARYVREGETLVEAIETFYHRLCTLRDRLHRLEAQLSAHPHVAPDEADAMGGYIRRCYGSLTSFNVLFRDREDYFTSTR